MVENNERFKNSIYKRRKCNLVYKQNNSVCNVNTLKQKKFTCIDVIEN